MQFVWQIHVKSVSVVHTVKNIRIIDNLKTNLGHILGEMLTAGHYVILSKVCPLKCWTHAIYLGIDLFCGWFALSISRVYI